MLKAWIFLMLAIVYEVFSISVMNYSRESNQIFIYGFMFAMTGVAYYFMSLSIRTISVGVAYAVWEIVGLSLITLIAAFTFDISLKTQEYVGLAFAIIDVVFANLGEKHEDEKGIGDV